MANTVQITAPTGNRLLPLVGAMLAGGWTVLQSPARGQLSPNRQKLLLRAGADARFLRLSFYSVTDSARGRAHERRIEITTTYGSRFSPDPIYRDVVIGYDRDRGNYVGVDPRRLEHGGPTSNASTFFSATGLERTSRERLLVLPYPSKLFGGTEYHAFFEESRFAEYLYSMVEIHAGFYTGAGPFSVPPRRSRRGRVLVPESQAIAEDLVLEYPNSPPHRQAPAQDTVEVFEQGERRALRRRKLTAEEFVALKRICEENGLLGEQFVLGYERQRLLDAGRMDLADRIEWTSQQSVGEGFDITSFNDDGTGRLIEVKATVGTGKTFEMTDLEWRTATAKRGDYFIYRVCNVRARNPSVSIVRDPVALEATGGIRRIPSGWLVTIS